MCVDTCPHFLHTDFRISTKQMQNAFPPAPSHHPKPRNRTSWFSACSHFRKPSLLTHRHKLITCRPFKLQNHSSHTHTPDANGQVNWYSVPFIALPSFPDTSLAHGQTTKTNTFSINLFASYWLTDTIKTVKRHCVPNRASDCHFNHRTSPIRKPTHS